MVVRSLAVIGSDGNARAHFTLRKDYARCGGSAHFLSPEIVSLHRIELRTSNRSFILLRVMQSIRAPTASFA
jgi:hypothetical protein